MQKLIVLFGIIFFSSSLFAGTRDPRVSDQTHLDYAKAFIFVGKLHGDAENDIKYCGSAVAIDDHHILTAAHVVDNSLNCHFEIDGKNFCITHVIIHKDFDAKKWGTGDIAIGYSEKPFNLEFYPKLYTEDNEVGKTCSIAGYGFTGTFITGANLHDDQKRAGSNIIDGITHDLLVCDASNGTSDDISTTLEFLIASGDSGGCLLINNQLAGINSCVMSIDKSPQSKYNEESGHTRISKFIDWINKNKRK